MNGHKGECTAVARADTRTAAKPTAGQMRVLKILEQLDGAADWRGVAAQERAARAVAAAVRTSMPSKAAWEYCKRAKRVRTPLPKPNAFRAVGLVAVGLGAPAPPLLPVCGGSGRRGGAHPIPRLRRGAERIRI